MSVEMMEVSVSSAEPLRPARILQQNRVFLDFFWDLANPDQEVRLKAVENLIQYLKTENKADELEYTLKRLVDGLAHTRETARPGFSLALGQVSGPPPIYPKAFELVYFSLQEPQVVLGCVQLLQCLIQHKQHLKDLPSKTMTDILTEVTVTEVFEEVLLSTLEADLASAFRTPEQMQLLLVALQHFPQALKPKKLKKLLDSSTIINADNIPKLVEVLKMAAHSVKKERVLPSVALDLLKLSLKEDSFQLFWDEAITEGMFKEPSGPTHYLSYRLLGSVLPLLSLSQLKEVLSGEVMMHYGEHVVSAQKPDRFKLAPEMDTYVSDFLQNCQDSDKQLAVMVSFSSLTNNGYPVVPSVWQVVQHLEPAALRSYVDWLKGTFLQPQPDRLLDFSTRKQKDKSKEKESSIFRLRKWIVARLASIINNHQVKKHEDLIMDVFFLHSFFFTFCCKVCIHTFSYLPSRLLMSLHHMPLIDDSAAVNQKRSVGVTADGTMWIYHLVQYAQLLLSHPKHVQSIQPFSAEQKQAWNGMLESVASLKRKAKKGRTTESAAFQQLFLLIGMLLFKAPDEVLDIMKDLQSCIDKAQEKKINKKKKQQEWVEVMVDILLSLLSQQSRHIRQVCKTVFSSICPHVTAAALTAIVLDPDKEDEEDGAVVVTDDGNKTQKKLKDDDDEEQDEDMEDDESEDGSDEESEGEEEEKEMEEGEVDQNFRLELMKVLQQQNALATEEDASSDEDLDDEAMMQLDKSLSALFSEQKKKTEEKKNEKMKLQKERGLVRDFKIKVLDLVEVFVARQAGSPLILGLVEPLLNIINRGMSSGSEQQEQDFLRRAADIFRNHLCRSKVYCRTAGDRQGELHDLLDKLMSKAQKLSDSSLCLYYFRYQATENDLKFMGSVDVDRVSNLFREALISFMSRRKSPLTSQMFTDLFTRFPVLCVNLLDTAVQHITSGVRGHQQCQACVLVLRAMQSRDIQQLLSSYEWTQLCDKVSTQLVLSLGQVGQAESKVAKEKLLKTLELCQFVVKNIHQQKLFVGLEQLKEALQTLTSNVSFKKTGKLEDTYWAVMKHFGVMKPKVDKTKPNKDSEQEAAPKTMKGFLPETKKRKKRNKPVLEPAGDKSAPVTKPGEQKGMTKKKQDKKTKQKRPADGSAASQTNPAKKSKTQPDRKSGKKKKPKQKKGGEQM
uniref:MYB binding protein (P160) 1a n=1 Tax=Poecilia latipinna TaxID=48699 RepID=A0A3B3V5U9_9TELE